MIAAAVLTVMMITNLDQAVYARFLHDGLNTIYVALLGGFSALAVALIMAYGVRLNPGLTTRISTRISYMGYAIPGSVISVGILIPFGWLDNSIDSWLRSTFGISSGLLLNGTILDRKSVV